MMRSRKRLKKRKPPAHPRKPYRINATFPSVVRGVVMPKPAATTYRGSTVSKRCTLDVRWQLPRTMHVPCKTVCSYP